jgi:hypothetical protein
MENLNNVVVILVIFNILKFLSNFKIRLFIYSYLLFVN